MLNKLLKFISESGDFSTISIAKKLNISEPMVEDMKDRLVKMGYVEKVQCSTEACEKCSCGCGRSRRINRTFNWKISQKGEKLLDKIGGRL